MVQDRATLTTADCNDVIYSDLEWLLTQISLAYHYSMLNISEMIQDKTRCYCRPLIESDMWPVDIVTLSMNMAVI